MSKLVKSLGILLFLINFYGCVPTVDPKPDAVAGANWVKFDKSFKSERVIQNMMATQYELLLISENQFFRFDSNIELVEKRALKVDFGTYQTAPTLTDNLYSRLIKTSTGDQALEFTSTKNSSETVQFTNKQIADTSEAMTFELSAITNGCFSTDGTKFIIAGQITKPSNKVVFYVFDIVLNPNADRIVSIKKIKTLVAPNTTNDLNGLVSSYRYLDGYFYAATKQGAFKISKDGSTISKFTPNWIIDFFKFNNKLYANGFGGNNSYESDDNGQTWVRIQKTTPLRIVTVTNNYIFNQEINTYRYKSAKQDIDNLKEIVYSADMPDAIGYRGVQFFLGNYYMNVDKEVFFTKNIVTK